MALTLTAEDVMEIQRLANQVARQVAREEIQAMRPVRRVRTRAGADVPADFGPAKIVTRPNGMYECIRTPDGGYIETRIR